MERRYWLICWLEKQDGTVHAYRTAAYCGTLPEAVAEAEALINKRMGDGISDESLIYHAGMAGDGISNIVGMAMPDAFDGSWPEG